MTREEKQKAIDALKISAPVMAVTQEEFNDYIHILNQVMDWLEQEPKWIPVSERLPEDGQEVQITYDAKRKTEKYHVWSAVWDEMHGRFYDKEYRSYICLDYVTAWMPLPKPFKSQESEG